MKTVLRIAVLLLPLLASATGRGSPIDFDLGEFDSAHVQDDVNRPAACAMTYLVENIATNETFAARMQFSPAPHAIPVKGRMPCLSLVPSQVPTAALDACRDHASDKADCVFADMTRAFRDKPVLANTADATSHCASDQASQIAIACLNAGGVDVCNVGCGEDAASAIAAARQRCEATHQASCGITAALPIRAP